MPLPLWRQHLPSAATEFADHPLDVEALLIWRVTRSLQAVMPHMIERGSGDIVATCSLAGNAAVMWEPVYSPSKWAVNCFVQTMRQQLNKMGRGSSSRVMGCLL